jgi:hypothetical protein
MSEKQALPTFRTRPWREAELRQRHVTPSGVKRAKSRPLSPLSVPAWGPQSGARIPAMELAFNRSGQTAEAMERNAKT